MLLSVLSHVIEPHKDIDRSLEIVGVVDTNEFNLLWQADANIPSFIVLINEELLILSVSRIFRLLLFYGLGCGLLTNFWILTLLALRYKCLGGDWSKARRGRNIEG